MEKVVIIGSSGHAKSLIDAIKQGGQMKLVGLVDSYRPIGESTLGVPILGKVEDLPEICQKYQVNQGIIAVGNNWKRHLLSQQILELASNFKFVNVIHPSAIVGINVHLGQGTAVLAGSVIGPDSTIGEHCIINTKASIDHDGSMADFSSLGPGSTLGGNVSIGKFSFVGLGSSIIQKVVIGDGVVIGAGSMVLDDIAHNTLTHGSPAKKIKTIDSSFEYF